MCVFCGIAAKVLTDSRYAYERRQAEMLVVTIEICSDTRRRDTHIEADLIERGFSLTEITEMAPTIITIMAGLKSMQLRQAKG